MVDPVARLHGPVIASGLRLTGLAGSARAWRSRGVVGRSRDRRAKHLALILEAVGRSMRAGSTVRDALRRACELHEGPFSLRLRGVVAGLDLGEPFERAIDRIARRSTSDELALVAALFVIVGRAGRGGAQALSAGSRSIRQAIELRHEVEALVTQARLSAHIMSALPPAFVGIGVITGQSGIETLFTSSFGRWCLGIGLLLDAAGLLLMRRLVHRVIS